MAWQVRASCSWTVKKMMKCRDDIKDLQYWQDVLQGKQFKTKLLYIAIRGTMNKVEWRHLIMHNLARPRAIFLLWLVLYGKLSTKDRLLKFGISVNPTCEFCNNLESIHHLFFECSHVHMVWKGILEWLGVHRSPHGWNEERVWIMSETHKKGWMCQLLKIACAETIYEVWKNRNEKIFSQKDIDRNLLGMIIDIIVARGIKNSKIRSHIDVSTNRIIR
ncbi:uncharacterized protein LOC131605068 [Vicia villosa]|uniref:uncharacterized protein LOC131605068 n=1 Tax=Vicia villosa TaxID=3911 RepID=UPI00273BA70D|nr:uncharacterized protein LOC131605068 [Vicia villosa]